MWLYTTTHHVALTQLFLLPAGVGVVASPLGFTASAALSMAVRRWAEPRR